MDATTLFDAVDLSTVATSLGGIVIIGLGIKVGFVIARLIKKGVNTAA
jgi:hypothetical protein